MSCSRSKQHRPAIVTLVTSDQLLKIAIPVEHQSGGFGARQVRKMEILYTMEDGCHLLKYAAVRMNNLVEGARRKARCWSDVETGRDSAAQPHRGCTCQGWWARPPATLVNDWWGPVITMRTRHSSQQPRQQVTRCIVFQGQTRQPSSSIPQPSSHSKTSPSNQNSIFHGLTQQQKKNYTN